jgi:hypothetical protein
LAFKARTYPAIFKISEPTTPRAREERSSRVIEGRSSMDPASCFEIKERRWRLVIGP